MGLHARPTRVGLGRTFGVVDSVVHVDECRVPPRLSYTVQIARSDRNISCRCSARLMQRLFYVNTEHVHRDDVPVDIYAVIIDNVLNGSEVYGSGRRLARAMLPISGGMCTSSTQLFSTATTTGRCSTRSAPPRPPTHLVATMPRHSSRGITPLSTRARGRTLCGSQLQQGAPTVSLPITTSPTSTAMPRHTAVLQ